MSAFLGPIHHWLYNKVKLQEELIQDILATSTQKGWLCISSEKLDSFCGRLELSPLGEIIDISNIHGWLNEQIGITETRFAFLVTELLKEDSSRLDDLKQIAYQFGRKHKIQNGISASEVLKAFENTLLDGMPCDHVNRVIDSNENSVTWKKTQCVHSQYWQKVGGDVEIYNALRLEIMTGMLADSDLALTIIGIDEFRINGKVD